MELLGLKPLQEYPRLTLFEDHFAIHQARELIQTIFGQETPQASESQGKNNILIYFEDEDLEGTFNRLKDRVRLIHPIQKQYWGQSVFRFYDPDDHIVEIGEPL